MNGIELLQGFVFVDGEDADLAIYAAWHVDEAVKSSSETIWEFELRLWNELECFFKESLVFWLV